MRAAVASAGPARGPAPSSCTETPALTPVAGGDERRPVERMGAQTFGATIAQYGKAGLMHGVAETSASQHAFIKRACENRCRAIVDSPTRSHDGANSHANEFGGDVGGELVVIRPIITCVFDASEMAAIDEHKFGNRPLRGSPRR